MKPEEMLCPKCEKDSLKIEFRMVANDIGTFSISGAQMKVTARERPVLLCGLCDFRIVGELDSDGRHASFPAPKL